MPSFVWGKIVGDRPTTSRRENKEHGMHIVKRPWTKSSSVEHPATGSGGELSNLLEDMPPLHLKRVSQRKPARDDDDDATSLKTHHSSSANELEGHASPRGSDVQSREWPLEGETNEQTFKQHGPSRALYCSSATRSADAATICVP
ncbi:hypothetical protein FZEAL_10364 [Fusarium zealandicum]|uniref:Uncharacterized protein n=1 Tax=Fusarium zealandicum TaxID=1053134 RepID=A0A8H4U2C7_9HYPO|nr:hypothetical protein FZEAL_10364 [Fusarium zealandicum]